MCERRMMIRVLALIAAMFFVVLPLYGQQGKMKFETNTHDFGRIQEAGGEVTYEFRFKNEGEAPVVIQGVSTSCGCTASDWERKPVLPGQEGFVRVTYNPYGRPGGFTKSVTVRSNGDPQTVVLFIRGHVEPRVKTPEEIYRFRVGTVGTKTSFVRFDRVLCSGPKSQEVEFYNFGERRLTLKFDRPVDYCHIEPRKLKLAPGAKGTVRITLDGTKATSWHHEVLPVHFSAGGTEGKLDVSFVRVQDFSGLTPQERNEAPHAMAYSRVYSFGTLPTGGEVEHTFVIKNTGANPLRILSFKPSCACVEAKVDREEVPSGEEARIQVIFRTQGYTGRQSMRVEVILNDPTLSTLNLELRGRLTD